MLDKAGGHLVIGAVFASVAALSFASNDMTGNTMADGTILVGDITVTDTVFYTSPADAPGLYDWNEANDYCQNLNAYGHSDWKLPTKEQLNELFNNRVAIGGFDESGSETAGWYWSSGEIYEVMASNQRFSDGFRGWYFKDVPSSVRCVRP